MRRIPFGVLLCLLLSMGCAMGRSLEDIQKTHELRICVAGSSAAFYQRNAEAFANFLKVAPKVTRLAEWDLQFTNSAGVFEKTGQYEAHLLANGSCDIFPNDLHILDWRASKMLLLPYYTTRKMVVARRDLRNSLQGPADLAGRTASVQAGTGYEGWLKEQNASTYAAHPVRILQAPTAESMARVVAREADFTVIGAEAAFKWVRGDLDALALLFPVDAPVEVGWGISPQARDLGLQLEHFFSENRHVGSVLDQNWRQQYDVSLMEYQVFSASFGTGRIDYKWILAWAIPSFIGVACLFTAILLWNRRLQHEVAERKSAEMKLADALKAADGANQMKSQFLATMSHEIRTPMNGILGMAQLLMLNDQSEATRKEYARVILNSGKTLLTLLNDILDLSKVEAGKMELAITAFDPAVLLNETALLFQQLAQEKGLKVSAVWNGPAAHYLGDPIRLRQMLSNYLSNAIKFSERGVVVVSAAELAPQAADPFGNVLVEFSVQDSGIGLTAQQQAMLFQPFTQVDGSATRRFGGTGLGLSIVRRLAEQMGGTCGVHSEVGRGARFWFRVRMEKLSAQPADAPRAAPNLATDTRPHAKDATADKDAGHARNCVLVVEDNSVNRIVASSLLQKLDCDVRMAENGQQAFDMLLSWNGAPPSLVLMDCQMPVMDGFEATRAIRLREQELDLPRLRIVALTAGAYAEERERCIAAGMDGFLAKPVDFADLKKLVGA